MASAAESAARDAAPGVPSPADPQESIERLLRDLRASRDGLSTREAARRLVVAGPNELVRRAGRRWPAELSRQLTHPLALLLWAAAVLAAVSGSGLLGVAIVVVIVINAVFAFVQEQHAEKAVEALAAYLPPHATVVRDGEIRALDVRDLVPGDVLLLEEGDRVPADARLLSGSLEVDLSTLTGESLPAYREAVPFDTSGPLLQARDLVFSGTTCTGGEARAVVWATGMRTEIGRIAALSQRVRQEESPLERQVRRVARLIAFVAIGMGLAFVPLGAVVAGLPLGDAVTFAIGLLAANVPEGLLPTITLALAVGVRVLARKGALVKRLSAVETLGSTSVICTDKTGTLTMSRMRVVRVWTASGAQEVPVDDGDEVLSYDPPLWRLAEAVTACTNATVDRHQPDSETGDPTERALLHLALAVGGPAPPAERLEQFHFDPALRRMSTLDRVADGRLRLHTKGAPEELLPRSTRLATLAGDRLLTAEDRDAFSRRVDAWAAEGLRVLAVAERALGPAETSGLTREAAESGLTLLGLAAMMDPPRPEVAEAVRSCHSAGVRVVVVTGDHGLTAQGIARRVGIGSGTGSGRLRVVTGQQLDAMRESELDEILASGDEVVFARSSPEAKLRVADALQHQGHVVAMTGDGVNDAPALRRADIGVAMGRSGTDVAREAATMVLTDDNFATIVSAIAAGRRVYDNVRKFIVYIFAHATPEVVPFLLYALSGGRIPLPLTVMQILAIDLGTETLPALALGRERAEPGVMERPPRPRSQGVIDAPMLVRSWGLLGGVSAVLVSALFFAVLLEGGWDYGDRVDGGPLHEVWRQATTMTFLGIVACQVGTAMASRTQHASLRQVGIATNPLLLWGIAFEIAFAAALVTVPGLQAAFGTAIPEWWQVAALLPMPLLVWGCDEAWRAARRAQPDGRPDVRIPSS